MEFCAATTETLGKPKGLLDGKYEVYHTVGRGQFAKYLLCLHADLESSLLGTSIHRNGAR